ncbi:MAG: response regulator [Oscillospiraceae bacterium]|nr:response regulator [Oscillospiraceae bacterium]
MQEPVKNKVLVVDDDKQSLIDIIEILDDDYLVYTAKDGLSALEKANEVLPDIILLDVIMPYMNGFDVLVELKKDNKTKDIPIIFITGMTENSSEYAGLSIGAIDYIRKPFDANITKLRVRHQIKIINLQRDLKQAAVVSEMSNHAKTVFLANMSHEIRTPMNSILGFSELAQDLDMTDKTREYIEKITDNSKLLLQIINVILDISKIETGKFELERVPFNPYDITSVCQATILPKAMDKDVELRVYLEPTTDRIPLGDPTRLLQVLVNLLSNAVKFTHKGVIKLFASVVSSDDDSITMLFEVKDTGIGMTQDQIEKIFEPFMQADSEITREYGGTGLGLTISKNIVEMMGSKLTVESIPGVGSRFSFIVTFETIDDASDEELRYVSVELQKPTFEGEVLICEDNIMNQQVVCEHLARVGLKTVVAENGKVGVEIVQSRKKSGKKQFDLVFMDIHMPVMDGFEASEKIIEIDPDISIVAMTANIMTYDSDLYKASGMKGYLGKPYTSQELWHCLMDYFEPIVWQTEDEVRSVRADSDLYRKLVNKFIEKNRNVFVEVESAVEAEDIKKAHRLVHTLKSNAAQLNHELLRQAALDVENCFKNGDEQVNKELMDKLKKELDAVLSELTPLYEEQSYIDESVEPLDAVSALAMLDELEPMLSNNDFDCIKYIDRLYRIPDSENLIRKIEDLDFTAAKEEFSKLQNNLKLEV